MEHKEHKQQQKNISKIEEQIQCDSSIDRKKTHAVAKTDEMRREKRKGISGSSCANQRQMAHPFNLMSKCNNMLSLPHPSSESARTRTRTRSLNTHIRTASISHFSNNL